MYDERAKEKPFARYTSRKRSWSLSFGELFPMSRML